MVKKVQQTFAEAPGEFRDYWKKSGRKVHGGEYAKRKRKTARPFSSHKPIHIVMRSSQAKGTKSMLRQTVALQIRKAIRQYSRIPGIRLYQYSNDGNHLHFLIRAKRKDALKTFLRSVAGHIARIASGAKKGNPLGEKFWDSLAFTRIGDWGRSFENLKKYVIQNILEASGAIPYRVRSKAGNIQSNTS